MSYCKACSRSVSDRARRRHSDSARQRQRRADLKNRYGITVEEYEALAVAQGNACAICRVDSPGRGGRWHIDHDHATGKVRGLLCLSCNVGLGHFRDDPALLRAAADYVG